MGKIELSLNVDAALAADAEANGVPLEAALEEGIRILIARREQGTEPDDAAKARRWAEENADAIKAHRERIEKFGVFGEDLRTW
jgi:antitoxin CcdA